ncbi:hypothetical protein EZV62_026436 [Acer yangbiense]|uniref:Uncharacterized protein n=1 Tax=Acer yangbiense TaxID=1000413 RepID=A0A5C7GS59_9ROSI|nr:hypothetical protein EZV62_026436 [Acer yangbiense]
MCCVCGSKSYTVLAGGGVGIFAALKKVVGLVGIFPFGVSVEFFALVGVGTKRREETIKVGLSSAQLLSERTFLQDIPPSLEFVIDYIYKNVQAKCGTVMRKKLKIKFFSSLIKENSIRNSDTWSWNLSYKDGSTRRNAATAYPKPLICSQHIAREGKEVELFLQVVVLGTRLLISTASEFTNAIATFTKTSVTNITRRIN